MVSIRGVLHVMQCLLPHCIIFVPLCWSDRFPSIVVRVRICSILSRKALDVSQGFGVGGGSIGECSFVSCLLLVMFLRDLRIHLSVFGIVPSPSVVYCASLCFRGRISSFFHFVTVLYIQSAMLQNSQTSSPIFGESAG